ncbi:hypothetical protein BGW36DRAFT_293155 [Talaromyces proteolyticus]|uniref:Azaphilone pigments biosynthesis cluster protein L N-terminal domain-containing protein n=1 Tax=Talaromyces proteolyticus TaxID=1131652 RepID=A0AAD4KWE2_9EURO|nr:uncharacterized protein BGW36DRAFT_293155 [Talaromyces proteolyticus]KAH8700713.1 hypothetical protein BGW36DRAFT_293155 [Talaromyces proteolyticus]
MSQASGVASRLVPLATFALNSSLALYETVVGFQSLPKHVRDLLQELEFLIAELDILDKLVQITAQEDLTLLDLPLKRCGSACKDFEQEIAKLISNYGENQISFHDWANLRYMGDNIDGFRRLLAVYKQTINIAVTNASLRKSSVTTETLEAYKELIKFAESDLEENLKNINDKLEHISEENASVSDLENTELYTELHTMKEERLSAEKCLKIYTNLSENIAQVELNPQDNSSSFGYTNLNTISEIHTKEGLQGCKNGLAITTARLEKYRQDVLAWLLVLLGKGLGSQKDQDLAVLTRLRDEWEAVQQCINMCSKADSHLKNDIMTTENYGTGDVLQFVFCTSDMIIHGRIQGFGWKTRRVGGCLNNNLLQEMSRNMTTINIREPANSELSSQHSLVATAGAKIGHDIPTEELSAVLRCLQLLYRKRGHKSLGAGKFSCLSLMQD